jgi:hypothetical protein
MWQNHPGFDGLVLFLDLIESGAHHCHFLQLMLNCQQGGKECKAWRRGAGIDSSSDGGRVRLQKSSETARSRGWRSDTVHPCGPARFGKDGSRAGDAAKAAPAESRPRDRKRAAKRDGCRKRARRAGGAGGGRELHVFARSRHAAPCRRSSLAQCYHTPGGACRGGQESLSPRPIPGAPARCTS